MSKVKINCHTDVNGVIDVSIKGECSFNELRAITGYLMASVVANDGIDTLDTLVEDIKKGIEDERNTNS